MTNKRKIYRVDILQQIPKMLVKKQDNKGYKWTYFKPNKNFKPKIHLVDEEKQELLENIGKEYRFNGELI